MSSSMAGAALREPKTGAFGAGMDAEIGTPEEPFAPPRMATPRFGAMGMGADMLAASWTFQHVDVP